MKINTKNTSDLEVAVTVKIKVKSNGKLYEEHKYNEVLVNSNLIENVSVSKITLEETIFSIHNKSVIIKTGEKKKIEIGIEPYMSIYEIKVIKARYVKMLEL